MDPRLGWSVAAIVWLGFVQLVPYLVGPQGAAVPTFGSKLFYAVLHVPFGVLLLGALARLLPRRSASDWRTLTLALGLAMVLAAAWWQQQANGVRSGLDLLMAALLGLALAVLLPRLLPEGTTRRWLGMERRGARR